MSYDVLIVGAGVAGVQVAASLRKQGFAGSIGIATRERHHPYELPPLSKGFLRGEVDEHELHQRPIDFFASEGIDLLLETEVRALSADAHTAQCADGTEILYGRLVWAAGGTPRSLPLPGMSLPGVHSMRTLDDARMLADRLRDASSAAIIGGGHIGLELAAAFRHSNVQTTVLEAADRLLARVTSPVVSDYYQRLHTAHGVNIVTGAVIESIEGSDHATGVCLADGTVVPADIVIVGVGLAPSIAPLEAAGAECSNGVNVDAEGRTSLPDVYAAGDCANRPNPYFEGQRVRLESVPDANDQARIVAQSIMGLPVDSPAVPWFWSHQYETRMQTVGLLSGYDEAVVHGDVDDEKFSVVYLRAGRIIAMDCVNRPRDFALGKKLVGMGTPATPDELRSIAELKQLLEPLHTRV